MGIERWTDAESSWSSFFESNEPLLPLPISLDYVHKILYLQQAYFVSAYLSSSLGFERVGLEML